MFFKDLIGNLKIILSSFVVSFYTFPFLSADVFLHGFCYLPATIFTFSAAKVPVISRVLEVHFLTSESC